MCDKKRKREDWREAMKLEAVSFLYYLASISRVKPEIKESWVEDMMSTLSSDQCPNKKITLRRVAMVLAYFKVELDDFKMVAIESGEPGDPSCAGVIKLQNNGPEIPRLFDVRYLDELDNGDEVGDLIQIKYLLGIFLCDYHLQVEKKE